MRLGVQPRGFHIMNGPIEWIAALGTILAASMIAVDLGRRWTGFGFVVFVIVAALWVASGVINHTIPLAAQNGVLLLINAWGVWQYLLNPRKKQVIERAEQIEKQAEREVG